MRQDKMVGLTTDGGAGAMKIVKSAVPKNAMPSGGGKRPEKRRRDSISPGSSSGGDAAPNDYDKKMMKQGYREDNKRLRLEAVRLRTERGELRKKNKQYSRHERVLAQKDKKLRVRQKQDEYQIQGLRGQLAEVSRDKTAVARELQQLKEQLESAQAEQRLLQASLTARLNSALAELDQASFKLESSYSRASVATLAAKHMLHFVVSLKSVEDLPIDEPDRLSEQDIPPYTCPITFKPMEDPVTLSSGHSYELAAIREWLGKNNTCPMTREQVTDKPETLKINRGLQQMIARFKPTDTAECKLHKQLSNRYKQQNKQYQEVKKWQADFFSKAAAVANSDEVVKLRQLGGL